jgi:hypothetical protein
MLRAEAGEVREHLLEPESSKAQEFYEELNVPAVAPMFSTPAALRLRVHHLASHR